MPEGEEYIIKTHELHIYFGDRSPSAKRRFNVDVAEGTVIHHAAYQQPKKSLFSQILADHEAVEQRLQRLHSMIDGHRGQYVALVIVCAWEEGWFNRKPSYNLMCSEFGDIGAKSNYHRQIQLRFTKEEKQPIFDALLKDMPNT